MTFKDILENSDISKGKITTADISKCTKVDHSSIRRLISSHSETMETFGELEFRRIKSESKKGGRPFEIIALNESQLLFLISIMKNNPKTIELKRIVADYCFSFEDINKFIDNFKDDEKIEGSVYIVQKKTGNIKIGVSKNPLERIEAIETHMGEYLNRKFVSEKNVFYKKIERKLHRHYKKHRILGEWFKIDFDECVWNLNKYILDENNVLESK